MYPSNAMSVASWRIIYVFDVGIQLTGLVRVIKLFRNNILVSYIY
jgi:hypothetical protein